MLNRLFYGWVLVGLTAGIMIVGTVPLFQAMSAWFVVFERHFGWSRTELSIAFVLYRVEGSVLGPVSGFLIDKLGPRRNVLIGLILCGAGFVLLSRTQELWHFYTAFVVITVGIGLGTWMPMITVLNNWFERHRAMAMALAIEGFLIGGVALVPVIVWAIDPDVPGRLGWRNTALVIGIIIIAVAWPLSRLVRNSPEPYGQFPDGEMRAPHPERATETPTADALEEYGYTWQEAVRTRTFWLITMGHACSSVVFTIVMVHLGPMLTDRGISLPDIGWVIVAYTAVAAVFTLIGGYVADRAPIRFVAFAFSSFQGIAIAVLLVWDSLATAFVFAALFGIGFGGRSPATTAIRGVYFGRKAYASILGISMIPMNLLMLGGPLYAGVMVDRTGSYLVPFAVIAALNLAGSAMFLFLGRPTVAPTNTPAPAQNAA